MSGTSGFKGSGITDPFLTPDAPTVDSVSAGVLSASVSFTAPTDTGGGAITEYVASAKQSDGSSVSGTGTSSPIDITLTAGGTTEFAVQAFNTYGAGQFSGYGNSTSVFTGQSLFSFGDNGNGALGQNVSSTTDRSSPVQIGADTDWNVINKSAYNRFYAIKSDGTLWAWGSNASDRLGDGTNVNRSSPVQIGALTNWAAVSSSIEHAVAVKTDGTLWTWGTNEFGQLGNNSRSISPTNSPIQIGSETNWSLADAGERHTLAITTDGELYAWGRGESGQTGHSDTVNRSSPVQVGSLAWSDAVAAWDHSHGITADGKLYSWGSNGNGRLGINLASGAESRSSPVQIGALTNWSAVSVLYQHTLASTTDGDLYGWGVNSQGQLGDNSRTDRSSPVQVASGVSNFSAGFEQCLFVKTDGTLFSVGRNETGELGLGDSGNTSRSSPVQVGAETGYTLVSTADNVSLVVLGSTS